MMDGIGTYSGTAFGERVRGRSETFFETSGDYHFATSDSQSCITTSAELSPGVIEGITKRLPSAETSNETIE